MKGTVICVTGQHLPGGRRPARDLWLCTTARPKRTRAWRICCGRHLRRFDQEHFHWFIKMYLGLDAAHLSSAQATDRWAALVMAAYTQLAGRAISG